MADAIIGMVLNRLAPVIERRVRDEVNLVLHCRDEAENLASKLKRIQELLEAAENKRVTDPGVKTWLEKIEDTAYEMDDALDEWEWEMKNLELEMEGSQQQDNVSEIFWEKVSSFIHSLCLFFQHSIERRRISLKIKELNGRLESIKKENDDEFKFLPNLPVDSQKFDQLDRTTTSYVELSKVTGRDDIKKELVSKLLSEGSQQENGIRTIAIVGPGGLGKTTLAQLAFRDSKVKEHFSIKSWICVSDPFDGTKIAKAILESLKEDSKDVIEFDTLLQRIESSITGERFLLVLDDVWTEDDKKWTPLKVCLDNGAPGSRILVTTRKEKVAGMMGAQIQRLTHLSDFDCWSLMSQIAFQGGKKRNPERLESIGRKIAKKCAGLPLAAKTLGSVLHWKDNVEDWEDILNSELWELEIVGEEIFPPIHLSYNELRPSIKRCFSYCAIYPKDSEIEADKLIRMWMAQGFLSSAKEEMEKTGREYLQDLVARSFFQDIEKDDDTGRIRSCKMHDIIHDFAQYVTKGECVIVDDKEVSCSNARHLALIDPSYYGRTFSISGIENLKKLRSFITSKFLPPKHVLGTLKCVRVLNLSDCDLKEVPSEIAKLVHLRYLDLSYNSGIRELPISLCHLYNLQTLILDSCESLSKLPEEIYNLINLRHLILDIDRRPFLPQGLEKLTCLRTLTAFRAKRGGSKLGYLKNLNQLEGYLLISIHNLNGESDAIEAENAELKKKTSLDYLYMRFKGEVSMNVKEALEPPPNLSLLYLDLGFGVEFPRWINTSLKYLEGLLLVSCRSLPPFGNLQSLERLTIWSVKDTKSMGHELLRITDGGEAAFPKLKELTFGYCDDWTEWEDIREEEENVVSIMPCLRKLSVQKCPKLKSLPHRLLRKTPLEYLNIYESDLIIEQYGSGKLRDEFLSPKCEVVIDRIV